MTIGFKHDVHIQLTPPHRVPVTFPRLYDFKAGREVRRECDAGVHPCCRLQPVRRCWSEAGRVKGRTRGVWRTACGVWREVEW